jgi:hypothetical protein
LIVLREKRMTLLRAWWPLLVAMVVSAPADAASRDVGGLAGQLKAATTFCDGTYALCIKAPCAPIVSRSGGSSTIDSALCSCEVVKGWSMGPASCAARVPVQQGGYTFLMSTYSNLFNATNRTLTCSSAETLWAWCYGSPCVVDSKDPNKASCTCPVKQSAASTLGGDCKQNSCNNIWSAATPQADAGANTIFAAYMKKNNPTVPSLPPAEACPVPSAPGAR